MTICTLQTRSEHNLNLLTLKSQEVSTNINLLLTISIHHQEKNVRRIDKIITKGKMLSSLIKFFQVILKEIYRDQFGEFVCGYWCLKG